MKKLYFKYLFSILWTLVLLYLSLGMIPSPEESKLDIPHLDKIVHFGMYFIYTYLLFRETQRKSKKTTIIIVLYAISFGILMEIFQATLFPYRSGDYVDAIFNSMGAISGVFAHNILRKIIKT